MWQLGVGERAIDMVFKLSDDGGDGYRLANGIVAKLPNKLTSVTSNKTDPSAFVTGSVQTARRRIALKCGTSSDHGKGRSSKGAKYNR